jgi:hypothetical protein
MVIIAQEWSQSLLWVALVCTAALAAFGIY